MNKIPISQNIHMKKEAIDLILEQNPQLKSKRQAFEALKPGTYCWHHSWGVGCIQAYDEVNNRVIIDFEKRGKGHTMDPLFCVQKLNFIAEDHVLIDARKNPEAIRELQKKAPEELVIKVLHGNKSNTLSKLELELILGHVLSPILSETQFKKWWYQTQKTIIKDPRIATPKKHNEPYKLREEPILPEQEILEEFYLTRRPLKKITLAEKLHQLANSIDVIRKDLPQILDDLTKAIQTAKQLTQAQRLQGCWVRNDLARYLHESVEQLEPTSQSLILETDNLSHLADSLPHVYYKRFLDLLTRTYKDPNEWQHICLQLLKNSSGKFTADCINFLIERECTSLLKDTLQKWLQEQTLKGPVLLWIIKQRNTTRYAAIIQPLLKPKLLGATFQAIDWDALNVSAGRRIPLVEALNEDKDLIAVLLENASPETARDLARNLLLNQGFDTLKKRSIMARFIRVFPDLQSLTETKTINTKEERLWVSQESLDSIRKEYELLINEKIPANKQAIATAREMGDLRENSEYKMARQDQDVLLARKSQIERDLSRAQMVNFAEAPTDIVGIGSVVTLEDAKGKLQRFSILGAWDSDPKQNILSYQSPFGGKLLGKKIGDEIELPKAGGTTQNGRIVSIERWQAKS